MKDAAKFHTQAWVKKTTIEAGDKNNPGLYKKWESKKQKQWQADYMDHCAQVAAMVVENATETLQKANTLKDKCKRAMDGLEKIVEAKRKKSTPMSDAEIDWVEKGKSVIEGSTAEFVAMVKAYSDNTPMALRENFMDGLDKDGAVTAQMATKIKTSRKAGIDIGNEFGKQSAVVARLAEYRQRWEILSTELSRLEKAATGKPQESAAELTKLIKDLQAGNEKWEQDFTNNIGKLVSNVEEYFKALKIKIDKDNDKSFGDSLLKNVKLLVSAKEKAKDKKALSDQQIQVKMKLDKWTTDLKGVKGGLKTRKMAHQSLTASLQNAGPNAEPFRKILVGIGSALDKRDTEVDALADKVKAAVAALK